MSVVRVGYAVVTFLTLSFSGSRLFHSADRKPKFDQATLDTLTQLERRKAEADARYISEYQDLAALRALLSTTELSSDNVLPIRRMRIGMPPALVFAPGVIENGGLSANARSRFTRDHRLLVSFRLLDNTRSGLTMFRNEGPGGIDALICSADSLAGLLPELRDELRAKAVMQVDWSTGADGLVVGPKVKSVDDLPGKTIAVEKLSRSHWLFQNILRRSTLDKTARSAILSSLSFTDSPESTRQKIVANSVDAAILSGTDLASVLHGGARPLSKTDAAGLSRVLADVMIVREELIARNPAVVQALISGWLEGAAIPAQQKEEVVKSILDNDIRLADLRNEQIDPLKDSYQFSTLEDNISFFGLSAGRPLFDEIFEGASRAWYCRGYIPEPNTSRAAKDDSFIARLMSADGKHPVSSSTKGVAPDRFRPRCESELQ